MAIRLGCKTSKELYKDLSSISSFLSKPLDRLRVAFEKGGVGLLAYELLYSHIGADDPSIVGSLRAVCEFPPGAAAAIEFAPDGYYTLYIDPSLAELLKADFERGVAFLAAALVHELGHTFFNYSTIERLYEDMKQHIALLPPIEKFREDVEPLMEGLVNEYVLATWKLGKKIGVASYPYGVPLVPPPGVVYIVERPAYRQFEEYYRPVKGAVEELAPYFEYNEQQTKCLQSWLSSAVNVERLKSRIELSEWGDYEFLGSLLLLSLIPENFRELIKRVITETLGIREWRFNDLPPDAQAEYIKACGLSPSDIPTLQQENPVVIREIEVAKRLVGKAGTCELWRQKRRQVLCPGAGACKDPSKCKNGPKRKPPRPPKPCVPPNCIPCPEGSPQEACRKAWIGYMDFFFDLKATVVEVEVPPIEEVYKIREEGRITWKQR